MKNILNEKPAKILKARLRFSTELVAEKDIRGKNIIDVGCGYGWFLLNALGRNAKKVMGIEVGSEDLKTSKDNVKNKKAVLRVGSAINIPSKDEAFDTAVSWEVIEHIPKGTEKKMFQEVYRVLKPGGNFYLSTPYDTIISKLFDPAFFLDGHRHYSKKTLINLGKAAGFKVQKVLVRGRGWAAVSVPNMYISKWIFRRKPFFERQIIEKIDTEYKDKEGFLDIFVVYKK